MQAKSLTTTKGDLLNYLNFYILKVTAQRKVVFTRIIVACRVRYCGPPHE